MPDRVSALVYSADGLSTAQEVGKLLATGPLEVVVVLDGAWPDPPLPDDPRVVTIFRGQPLGWPEAVKAATATWVTDLKETAMAKSGPLVIMRATYGVGDANGQSIDVTKSVARLLGGRPKLSLKVTNDALKAGPIFAGQRKRLTVAYTLNGVAGSTSALERKTLTIPPVNG
jgi:hypothetical protein